MSSRVETSLIINSKRFLDAARNNRNGPFTIVDLTSGPRKKNRDAVLSAPLLRKNYFSIRLLRADLGVIGEVQVVRSGAIEIDPTLDHVAVT